MAKKPTAPKTKTEAAEVAAPAAAPAPAPKADTGPKFKHNKKLEIVGTYSDDSKITWNVKENPRAKGRGTYDRFAAYMGKPTVGEYKKAGGTLGDLNWDLRTGYLTIEGVTLGGELTARQRKEKKEAAPKAAKEPKGKPIAQTAKAAEVEAEAKEETME